jgi:hypothetical protein
MPDTQTPAQQVAAMQDKADDADMDQPCARNRIQ